MVSIFLLETMVTYINCHGTLVLANTNQTSKSVVPNLSWFVAPFQRLSTLVAPAHQ